MDDAATSRPLAVVTPLFRDRAEAAAWAPVTVALPQRRARRWGGLAALSAFAAAAVALFHSHLGAQRVAERLETGCLDVDDCRALVHAAETASDRCWLGCASQADFVSQARLRFRAALELAAHQERQRQDNDYERALATRRQTETARLDREHEQHLIELDRQHRHELAVLAAETERAREERERARLMRVSYLRQLTREQRLARLNACHDQGTACDELMVTLAEAAATRVERTELIDAHERHVTGQTPRVTRQPRPPVNDVEPSLAGNSPPGEPPPL